MIFISVPRAVTNADYPALEKVSESAIKEKQKFERLVVPKETLLEMFSVSWMISHILCLTHFPYVVQQIQEAPHRDQDS